MAIDLYLQRRIIPMGVRVFSMGLRDMVLLEVIRQIVSPIALLLSSPRHNRYPQTDHCYSELSILRSRKGNPWVIIPNNINIKIRQCFSRIKILRIFLLVGLSQDPKVERQRSFKSRLRRFSKSPENGFFDPKMFKMTLSEGQILT